MQLLAKTGCLLYIALLLKSPSPAGWQGVALYMVNISFKVKEKVTQEIQLEQTWNLVNTSQFNSAAR